MGGPTGADDRRRHGVLLDVDGQRPVVDASYGADAITEQRDQLAAMVESLEFVAPAA